jgi:hypothetical protein
MIYTSTKILPYVYICYENGTDRYYIGYRYTNKIPSSDDLGKVYFTSNKYVKQNFKNFKYAILAEFFDKKGAYEFESLLLAETAGKNQINFEKYSKFGKYKRMLPQKTPA